jgi:hypothetical protein
MERARSDGQGVSKAAIVLCALAASLILPSMAQARLAFPPPQTLSPVGESASDPSVAVDPQDRATVAWLRFDGGRSRIESVRVDADGVPGEVSTLLAVAEDRLLGPQVAVGPDGRAIVVWERDTEAFKESDCSAGDFSTCVQAVSIAPDGTPSPVMTLARFDTPERDPDLGGPGKGPQVAVDSQGRATVAWRRTDYAAGTVVQSMRLAADGSPGTVQTLSAEGAGDPSLAVGPDDRVTVTWPRSGKIESVRLGADGTPEPLQTLFKRGTNDDPQVAVDRRGRATVVCAEPSRPRRIRSVRLDADGDPGAVETLARGSRSPRLDVDPRGRATVVWERTTRGKRGTLQFRVQSMRLRTDGKPRAVKTLSKSRGSLPEVAVDARGRAMVVWHRLRLHDKGGIERIEGRRLRPGRAPEPVQTLAKKEGVGFPRVAVDSSGRPTVVWAVSDLSVGGLIEGTRGRERR